MDVHGAGCQRSDPKSGNPANYPYGHGPQGDVIRIYNYVRLVRNAENFTDTSDGHSDNSNNPKQFELSQNYPNPFNSSTTIAFSLTQPNQVILKIFNILGEQIATLVERTFPVGNYQFQWQAENLPSGIYYYTLKSGSFSETKRMFFLK